MTLRWPRLLRFDGERHELVDQRQYGLCKVCKGRLTRADRGTGYVGSSIRIYMLLPE
jgi:hypothetical protein